VSRVLNRVLSVLISVSIWVSLSGTAKAEQGMLAEIQRQPDMSRRFMVSETLRLKDQKEKVLSVIYGNADYGFFESRRMHEKVHSIEFKFVPPGYLKPIQIFLKVDHGGDTRLIFVKSNTYESPVKNLFSGRFKTKGRFSSGFFLFNFWIRDKILNKLIGPLLTIVNSNGEVVWILTNSELTLDGDPYRQIWYAAQSSDRSAFHVLYHGQKSYYQSINIFGDSQRRTDFNPSDCPNHDFVLEPGSDELVFLDFKRKHVFGATVLTDSAPSVWKTISRGILSYAFPLVYQASYIQELNLATGVVRELWDPFYFFSPKHDFNRELGSGEDVFLHPLKVFDYLKMYYNLRNPGSCFASDNRRHVDWMHANSIRHVLGKGYLISIRNFDKIIFVDERFKKIIWSLGPEESDTYHFESQEDVFSSQHDASINSRGNLLVFDNHGPSRGIVETKGPSRIVEIKLDFTTKKARVVWSFSPKNLFSEKKGSVSELPGGNVLGFFPVSGTKDLNRTGTEDRLFEVNPRTGKVVGEMSIGAEVEGGYRAVPVNSLSEDVFIGKTLPL